MNIKKIISEHKRLKKSQPVKYGFKRVEAIVEENGFLSTRHIDIKAN
jgi:hypothetical protein